MTKKLSALLVLAIFGVGNAHATVLDFEGLMANGGSSYFNTYGDLTVGDYSIPAPFPYLAAWKSATTTEAHPNYSGSVALFADAGRELSISRIDGTAFNLLSIDVANLYRQSYVAGSASIVFTGHLASGGVVVQSYTGSQDDALHTVSFLGFTGLSSVTWEQSGSGNAYHQFDNVSVTPVPEPATMLALSTGALVLVRRRKRS